MRNYSPLGQMQKKIYSKFLLGHSLKFLLRLYNKFIGHSNKSFFICFDRVQKFPHFKTFCVFLDRARTFFRRISDDVYHQYNYQLSTPTIRYNVLISHRKRRQKDKRRVRIIPPIVDPIRLPDPEVYLAVSDKIT